MSLVFLYIVIAILIRYDTIYISIIIFWTLHIKYNIFNIVEDLPYT